MMPRTSARASSRGYTIVELLMAVCVFGIGVMGIIGMQKVTATSNRHAKNLAIATHIAESWLEHIAVDAQSWTQLQGRAGTQWLNPTLGVWDRPGFATAQDFGPAFDAQGAPLPSNAGAVFCTHVRLAPLISDTTKNGYGLMRVDVRVFWPRDGERQDADYCQVGTTMANVVGASPDRYHFVYKTTAVRQTPL